jgi:quercetin dioxygenase-like cupin family protein
MTAEHGHDTHLCPNCQQGLPMTGPAVVNTTEAVEADALTADDAFKRTYVGHGKMSSVFIFQGHKGPFRAHIHPFHDEIGYVLAGSGSVTIGDDERPVRPGDVWVIPANTPHAAQFGDEPVRVLFVSSPIDDPDNQDRVWLDEQ